MATTKKNSKKGITNVNPENTALRQSFAKSLLRKDQVENTLGKRAFGRAFIENETTNACIKEGLVVHLTINTGKIEAVFSVNLS